MCEQIVVNLPKQSLGSSRLRGLGGVQGVGMRLSHREMTKRKK